MLSVFTISFPFFLLISCPQQYCETWPVYSLLRCRSWKHSGLPRIAIDWARDSAADHGRTVNRFRLGEILLSTLKCWRKRNLRFTIQDRNGSRCLEDLYSAQAVCWCGILYRRCVGTWWSKNVWNMLRMPLHVSLSVLTIELTYWCKYNKYFNLLHVTSQQKIISSKTAIGPFT